MMTFIFQNTLQKLGAKSEQMEKFLKVEKSLQEIIENLNEFSTSHRNVQLYFANIPMTKSLFYCMLFLKIYRTFLIIM